eukprot:1122008_1
MQEQHLLSDGCEIISNEHHEQNPPSNIEQPSDMNTISARIKRFHKTKALYSYLLLYTLLTFILAVIGGVIFHFCEYRHEERQINDKIMLYNKIKDELPSTSHDDLDVLLGMCGVPLVHHHNRWRLETATFFAFTTASTIGYGYTTPQTFWGRFCTFFYGLPAICVFGLAMVQIGRAVSHSMDQRISAAPSHTCTCFNRCRWMTSVEFRRTCLIFGLLMSMILVSGAVFGNIQDNWTYADGVYFMWISISTIGYGDLHPDVIETTIWANVILWLGLAMTALLIGSAQDFWQKKFKETHVVLNENMHVKRLSENNENIMNDNNNDYQILQTSVYQLQSDRL